MIVAANEQIMKVKFITLLLLMSFLKLSAQCTFSNQTYTRCSGGNAQFNAPTGYTFSWSLPSITPIGSVSGASASVGAQSSFVQALSNSGTQPATAVYTMTPQGNGCSSAQTFTISILVNPIPSVTSLAPQTLCSQQTTQAINFIGNVSGTSFNWESSNTQIGLPQSGSGNIPAFTAYNPNTINISSAITVTPVANGCSGSAVQACSLTVKPVPFVSPGVQQTYCENVVSSSIPFESNIFGSSFAWTNSNATIGLAASGNTSSLPSFTSSNPTNAPISSTITVTPSYNGCAGNPVQFSVITVNPTPVVDTVANQSVCNGGATSAINFSSPVANTFYSSWINSNSQIGLPNSGNGTIASFEALNYSQMPQTATISVSPNANGCFGASTVVTSITVRPSPVPNPLLDIEVCSGETVNVLPFSSSASNVNFAWQHANPNIGIALNGSGNIPQFQSNSSVIDASEFSQFSFTASENGLGCISGNPQTFGLLIKPKPSILITPSIVEDCNNYAVGNFQVTSPMFGAQFQWNSLTPELLDLPQTGVSSQAPFFNVFNQSALNDTALIQFIAIANGCVGLSDSLEIVILPSPAISNLSNISVCANQQTEAILMQISDSLASVFWTNPHIENGLSAFGNTNEIPSFLAMNTTDSLQTDTVLIYVTSSNSCVSDTFITVTISPESLIPSANFTANADNATVTFSLNDTLAASNATWDFGDGSMAEGFNVTHTYSENGQFEVQCLVSGFCGQQDSSSNSIQIAVGIEMLSAQYSKFCYPNPFTDIIQLNLTNDLFDKEATFELYDMQAQLLVSKIITPYSNSMQLEVSMLKPGIYVGVLKTQTNTYKTTLSNR
jgi:hypothetical protein